MNEKLEVFFSVFLSIAIMFLLDLTFEGVPNIASIKFPVFNVVEIASTKLPDFKPIEIAKLDTDIAP